MDVSVIASHCSCHGGYGELLLFRWLWDEIRWYSIPVYFGVISMFAFGKSLLGVKDCND